MAVESRPAFLSSFYKPLDGALGKVKKSSKCPVQAIFGPSQEAPLIRGTRFRTLGPFENVSVVGCGTWSWGNRLLFGYNPSQDEELQRSFNAAVALGCNFFDSGDSYGTGTLNARAEHLLGKFIRECTMDCSNVLIASKAASYPWRLTPRSVADAVARSAERIGRPIDLAQIHWSSVRYAPWQEHALWKGMAEAQGKGDCVAIGVSNYGPKQLRKVQSFLKEFRGISLASVQIQLSLLSRDPLKRGNVIDVAKELGVGVIGYSPLCLGVLSGKYGLPGPLPRQLSRRLLFQRLLRGSRALQDELAAISYETNSTVAQVAIAWCLSKDVLVISGVRTEGQASELMNSNVILTSSQIQRLEQAASRAHSQMVQNVFQTS